MDELRELIVDMSCYFFFWPTAACIDPGDKIRCGNALGSGTNIANKLKHNHVYSRDYKKGATK